jgi:glutamate dehydrogenase (NAD(P)+)
MEIMSSELNPFLIAQRQLDEAAAHLGLSPAMHAFLREPMQELHFTIPVQMDDGSQEVFKGFRIQYNTARGPAKGGIRYHANETVDTIRALSAWMTWKTALLDLPLGGGKGGIVCDPRSLSQGELERLSRGYMRKVAAVVGPDRDVPAPDVYTNPQIMAWMMDEYEVITGRHLPGVITGKPVNLFGSLGRGDATARGGLYTLREAVRALGLDVQDAAVAIQGYGNAGQFAHQLGSTLLGLKTVAISDSRGGIYNPKGIDYAEAVAWKRATGSVIGFRGADNITNTEILELPVTVLFPAALENVITEANAPRIRAKVVGELANGPTTPEADRILHENGVYVIPDFLCNAGGVTVSYFEQVQNAYNFYWPLADVQARLDARMTEAFHAVHEIAQTRRVHNRLAAYIVAVRRVAEAVALRGWVR